MCKAYSLLVGTSATETTEERKGKQMRRQKACKLRHEEDSKKKNKETKVQEDGLRHRKNN
jgi:uncharacterized protein YlxW (UPF0749 family)